MNCKLIVVACNTATTNAIKELRTHFNLPFIGIEPAIKPAAIHSKTQTIGILATQGTLNSDLFHETAQKFSHTKIIEQVGHGLVPLIEDGKMNTPEMYDLLTTYLKPMIAANIDFLVLGCSHYPYLIPLIKKILPKHIQIIDSGQAAARQTKNVLEQVGFTIEKEPRAVFYTNTNPVVLQTILGKNQLVLKKDF